MMKTKLEKDWVLLVTYLYLFAPLLIFVFTWLKLYIGIPLGVLTIYGIYTSFKKETPLSHPKWDRRAVVFIFIALAIVLLWVLTSGIGGSAVQYPDHIYRNVLYKVLVDRNWPVYIQSTRDGSIRGLTYYIGFWLPAALVGKATSYTGGMLFMQIWAVLGIMLVWFYICEKQQKVRLWFLVVFIFFGGLDPIGRLITGNAFTQVGNRYEWWAVIFNYPGMSTHLFWVYNQVIYAWVIYCLIMRQKNNKSLMFIWCNALLCCTFPAVGLVPFVIWRAIKNEDKYGSGSRLLRALRKCLTYQNIVGVGLTVVLLIYVMANDAVVSNMPDLGLAKSVHAEEYNFVLGESSPDEAESIAPDEAEPIAPDEAAPIVQDEADTMVPDEADQQSPEVQEFVLGESSTVNSFSAYPITTKLMMYLWFILLEFGLYYMVIYKSEHKKSVYWLSLAVLLVCPWIKVGYWIDFCLRACIPALFCLYMLVISALQKYFEQKERLRLILLIGMLAVSSATTADTFVGVLQPVDYMLYDNAGAVPQLEVAKEWYLAEGENFSGKNNAFFFKYMARKPGQAKKTSGEES